MVFFLSILSQRPWMSLLSPLISINSVSCAYTGIHPFNSDSFTRYGGSRWWKRQFRSESFSNQVFSRNNLAFASNSSKQQTASNPAAFTHSSPFTVLSKFNESFHLQICHKRAHSLLRFHGVRPPACDLRAVPMHSIDHAQSPVRTQPHSTERCHNTKQDWVI